ncbi:uroporphyrinogen-III synthase [SAR92 clade bacterium H921]|nr:uroporphyrinogen-III synthase [SAR92 clade bacterium H921]
MVANSLAHKRILVVRPLRAKDTFLALLEQSGAAVTYTPIMCIEPLSDSQPILNHILKFDQFDQAIFISANAAEIGLQWLDQYWPMLPVGMELFAVGQKTADILTSYGCRVICPSQQQNTEGLLALEQLRNLRGKSTIIFRGGGGRQTLGDTLESRGATVTYCELYRRVIEPERLALAQSQAGEVDCLVIHSGELLRAMADSANLTLPVVVPSERVAHMARQLGYATVVVAENALPEKMYSATMEYFNTR